MMLPMMPFVRSLSKNLGMPVSLHLDSPRGKTFESPS